MDDIGIRSLHLTSEEEALDALKRADVDPDGIQAMLPKMFHLNIMLDGMECRVANIIKQEMLSLGGMRPSPGGRSRAASPDRMSS